MTRMKTLSKKESGDELEGRVRKALAARAEPVTSAQFKQIMQAIVDGRCQGVGTMRYNRPGWPREETSK